MMKYTIALSVFVSIVFAQQSALSSQCISSCENVLSISDSCSNSTGYAFDADVVLAQEYLNCICATSNTGIMNQYDRRDNSALIIDVFNALSKLVKILVGLWTPRTPVHLALPILIPSQASTVKVSPEFLQEFQVSLWPPPRAQAWFPLQRYNEI